MPQGVQPWAQPLQVPSTRRPSGSAAVRMSAWPAAGPAMRQGERAVRRRAYGEGRTRRQAPSFNSTSTTETPTAFWAFVTFSALHVF